MLSKDVESLLNDIGKGTLNESVIKGRLALIQEQAEAQDAEIERIKAELKHAEKRITSLELELHEQQDTEQPSELQPLDDKTFKVLEIFFHMGEQDVTSVSRVIRLSEGMVKYHRDILLKKGFIYQATAGVSTDEGDFEGAFDITPEGREFAVQEWKRRKTAS